ncbi:MAG TPA: hypothetical protein VGN13_13785 [Solirubrobacteraceae bacterium]|jgi:MFS family permease
MNVPLTDLSPTRRPARAYIPDCVAVACTVLGIVFAPKVDTGHPASSLSPFFATVATVSVTLVVAIALFQAPLASSAAHRARGWLSGWTFLYLGLATIVATLAATGTLDSGAYRWLFGFSVGPGVAGLVTVLLMGRDSIAAQSELAIEVRARLLDPRDD